MAVCALGARSAAPAGAVWGVGLFSLHRVAPTCVQSPHRGGRWGALDSQAAHWAPDCRERGRLGLRAGLLACCVTAQQDLGKLLGFAEGKENGGQCGVGSGGSGGRRSRKEEQLWSHRSRKSSSEQGWG